MVTRKTLTFEKALTRLLALMGTRVEVTILSEEPRGLLAFFEGELSRGGAIEQMPYPAGNEGFVFRLAGEQTSFVLESRMLRRAVLLEFPDDRPDSLRFYLGVTTVLQVDPVEDEA